MQLCHCFDVFYLLFVLRDAILLDGKLGSTGIVVLKQSILSQVVPFGMTWDAYLFVLV